MADTEDTTPTEPADPVAAEVQAEILSAMDGSTLAEADGGNDPEAVAEEAPADTDADDHPAAAGADADAQPAAADAGAQAEGEADA